ncbi:GYDIA family GHMP kinase [Pseudozobellia thermophila]|uniref:Mevalonate kinase n=1 Tax=Pseudozobellia thermophila TaxID=192903 RepID=A0A1M6D4C1_9FLAO|nr:GYDIA family GHMP kinase [Pseudozobellia thermophila]SHI68059.1 Mevalonate kinase [Pseudozobellia thermophila]
MNDGHNFYSHGKLLLTGEYAVLDGALSLAIPTRFGQTMKIEPLKAPYLKWRSLDHNGTPWFEASFERDSLFSNSPRYPDDAVAATLLKLLGAAKKLNPRFLADAGGYAVETFLEFPRNWGLGSSSTLINNMAQWAQVDAFQLLWKGFSGSGYDIACARNHLPIAYQVIDKKPAVETVAFNPTFANKLFFVHLEKKQDSREGIRRYRNLAHDKKGLVDQVSALTRDVLACTRLYDFEQLLERHEKLISDTIQLPTVKESLFPDYFGTLKSLGAWGGDFILATGNEDTPPYFHGKGFKTVIPYPKMIA